MEVQEKGKEKVKGDDQFSRNNSHRCSERHRETDEGKWDVRVVTLPARLSLSRSTRLLDVSGERRLAVHAAERVGIGSDGGLGGRCGLARAGGFEEEGG
jgi:hypothetical protein